MKNTPFSLLRACVPLLCLGLLLSACAGESPPSPGKAAQASQPAAPVVASPETASPLAGQPRDLFEAFKTNPPEFNALFTNPAQPTLPDLNRATKVGQQPAQDFLPTVPGPETTITAYQVENVGILVFSLPNGKIYAFTLRKVDTGEERSFFDKEGDGIFEQQGDTGDVDEKAYGY
ncbi:hypothetical protein [Megalodesulfovibrio gigas]|uniref:Lipoprotein n=1 Tax=Megalodesulfovibrio gigas (strain ATCC 19364 / DSM 1382 / NCIMB 9332 / VKM B-1759) TaxID=1121448 RepID=T2GF51_MEGG1|nr:hypothetical protein [Megalodesulfovibrio gigas]AGW14918.1 hypothetical protein DGI_3214 [Megalodesulfovibrio gigas DSM 1382 = ATCC 19364]